MDKKLDTTIIDKYLSGILQDKYHRYLSWDYCFNAFAAPQSTENHALQLGFYLASWGMYRGSGGLLQKNHLVHTEAVIILYEDVYKALKCNSNQEVNTASIDAVMDLKLELGKYYTGDSIPKNSKGKGISDTDTLLSKIMLGTLGCVPAYDRYFIDGLKEENAKHTKFNVSSLKELFTFTANNTAEITECQNKIMQKTQQYYPVMKIVDMYFWQIGFDKAQNRTPGLKYQFNI